MATAQTTKYKAFKEFRKTYVVSDLPNSLTGQWLEREEFAHQYGGPELPDWVSSVFVAAGYECQIAVYGCSYSVPYLTARCELIYVNTDGKISRPRY